MAVALPVLDTFKAAIRADLDTPDGLTEEERLQVVRDRVSRTLGMFNRQRNIQLDSALARWTWTCSLWSTTRTSRPVPPATKGRAALESEVVADIAGSRGSDRGREGRPVVRPSRHLTLNDGRPGRRDNRRSARHAERVVADSSQSNQATVRSSLRSTRKGRT